MTITSEATRITHAGDATTKVFAYNWRILDDDDLLVILRTSAGVETIQTITTHYTVQGVGVAAGGTVTFGTAPGATDTVVIILDPPMTQETDYTSGGAFPAQSHEDALDRLTNQGKRTRDLASRSLSLTDGSTPGSGEYDADSQRIINVADPTADQDAATKAFVQAEIAAAVLDPTTSVSAYGATLIDDANAAAARTTLGAGSTGGSIFVAANTGAVWTALDVANGVYTALETATSAVNLRDLLFVPNLIPYANLVVNPDFKIWQTGTSRTSVTTFPNNDDTYFADGWILLSDGNDQVDITNSAALFGYPTNCYGLAEFDVEGAAKWGFLQIIESAHSIPWRSKNIKVSFQAQSNATLAGFRCHLVSWSTAFTADSVTSDIVSAWNGATTKPTPIANVTLVDDGVDSTFTTAGAWNGQSFTFAVPSNAVNIGIFICTNDASYSIGDKVGFSGFKLGTTEDLGPFQSQMIDDDLDRCNRFYTKTFPLATVPVQNVGNFDGAIYQISQDMAGTQGGLSHYWRFPVRMLRAPSVTTYNPRQANANWRNAGNTADKVSVAPAGASEVGVNLSAAAAGVTHDTWTIHATADARL